MNRKFLFLASILGLTILIGACEPATPPADTPPPATPTPSP